MESKGLEVLAAPAAVEITVAGKTLALKTMDMEQIAGLIAVADPLLKKIEGAEAFQVNFRRLYLEHSDQMVSCAAIASRQPREWVSSLSHPDFITFGIALLGVNPDFFLLWAPPGLLKPLEGFRSGTGATASNASSPTATG